MKQTIKTLLLGLAIGGIFAVAPLAVSSDTVSAAGVEDGLNMTKGSSLQTTNMATIVQRVINVLLWAIGIVSVVMIILGGIRYAMSSGDSARAKSAMNTILYAVIGLVIAIFAYAIVDFVVKNMTGK